MKTLLAQSRDIATNATEGSCPIFTTETARHLLSHLSHAKVSLRLIVVERHPKVTHEAQYRPLLVAQSYQQVVGFALFYPSSVRLNWRRWRVRWVERQPLSYPLPIATLKFHQALLRQTVLP